MSDHASSDTATQIAQNSVFERFARAGYVVSGLLHLTIGYLAIRIALGSGGGSADQSGALAAVAAKPGGIAALWAQQGHRTRRSPQNTRGPTLRSSTPDRHRRRNHHLRPLQLRHGPIHQNVRGPADSAC